MIIHYKLIYIYINKNISSEIDTLAVTIVDLKDIILQQTKLIQNTQEENIKLKIKLSNIKSN